MSEESFIARTAYNKNTFSSSASLLVVVDLLRVTIGNRAVGVLGIFGKAVGDIVGDIVSNVVGDVVRKVVGDVVGMAVGKADRDAPTGRE
jgi:hypothetical protein